MEVLKPRAAFLSNFEVYSLLQDLEQKQLEETRAALATKREEHSDDPSKGTANHMRLEEPAENVRTIQLELLKYFRDLDSTASRQTVESVSQLTRALRNYGLTKAEKLQIVNHAPKEEVDLYVLVEEVEERLNENKRAEILDLVQRGLREPLFLPGDGSQTSGTDIDVTEQPRDGSEDEGPTEYPQDEGYDEDGEGEGFEGDLEIDEVPD